VVAPPVVVPVSEQQPPPPAKSAEPTSYVYFFTGVPVRPAPMTVVYTGGFTSTVPVVSVVPTMPVVQQTYSVPIFTPQVVPSRVGAPKLVYTNGVVIKPKVYYPKQPLRNSLRGITP
jgi:hypothetical protein